MPYKHTNSNGIEYFLHRQEVELKNGAKRTMYFFGKEADERAIDEVPEGYVVTEAKNGLPILKKEA